MTIQTPLADAANHYRLLRSVLIEQHGLDEDEQALFDTLDGASDLMDQLSAMLRRARELDRYVGMVAEEQKQLAERKAALEEKASRLRRIVVYFLGLIGRRRIEAPDFAYTLSNGQRSLVGGVEDAKTLPVRFQRVKVEEDRKAIKAALKGGEVVEGYSLSNASQYLRSAT